MYTDIPLTDLFWCPACGYRGLFHAEPTAYVKCICGRRWVIGDYDYYLSLTREERKKIMTWDVSFYKDHRELNHSRFDRVDIYS
jgi:hypothetical protein